MSDYILFTESSPNVGGQELQLMQQMAMLAERGFRPMLACRPGSRVEEVALGKGLEVLPLRFRNSAHLPTILRLRSWMAKHKPRLAICHSGHDSNNLSIAARLLRQRPFLLRSRTYQPGSPSAWSYNQLVDATMLPSRYLKDCLLDNPEIHAERLHVVYPGIDFAELDENMAKPLPTAVEAWLAAGEGPVLAHAAMLRGEKGHMTLLAALHALRERWPNVRYVIAGEGGERERIVAEIERLGLQSRVLLAGMVSPVAAVLARADLVVMPSSYEPLGMSQIEALGLGVPVVVSRTGGIPETVRDGETGLLAAPGDIDAWARVLDQALSDPERMRRMAQAGRADVRARFAPEHNLRSILELAGLASPSQGQT
ncbi:glycosyltransferase family 1 protein [Chromobacterium sinusclupearum]|uniref:Glycosyltransferase family 1 protein n=1 Tax=Chromobacterium sinusclupearum TaxID=2077146 RepID=A0A2K4MJW1_9NEIS|nr:glycosyltransferase family 4 protein [Chromobacterium sinusclupearum]POA97384.1 glycosyltransferase family 1 protein [Chromobacterium sinusclupearum]